MVAPRRETVSVNGSFGDWSPITVHLDGEISVRDRSVPYKGAMFAVYPGDIVFSKIDARSGAIGMLPTSIAKAVVTPEFPVFVADPAKLDSGFVQRVLRTGGFLKDLRSKATGTSGRKRISPEAFLDLRVPLPDLADQQAIVAAYDAALVEAAGKEKAADAAEAKAMADFEAALGFAPPVPLPDRPIFVASFKDLDRWSHDAVLRRLIPEQPSGSKWPEIRLSEVAEVVYGLQKHPGNRPGLNARPYLRVANVQRGKIDITEMKLIDVDDTTFRRLNLIKDDLLFVEGNGSRANLGRVAIWYGEIDGCIHQNHLIRARLDLARVTAQFAAAWFNSDAGRSHFFNEGKTTSGLGTINSTVIRDAPLPLPPISIQTALMEELNDAIAQANARRREAAVLRANAWRAFEASVYAADDTITATNIADAEAELVHGFHGRFPWRSMRPFRAK